MIACRRNSTGADGTGPPSAAKHPHRDSTGLAAAEPVHLYGDSYALQAARRSEKRRLTAFIKLVDYMLADSVHSMVKAGLKHVLNSFRGQTPLPEGTVSNAPLSAQVNLATRMVWVRLAGAAFLSSGGA